MKKELNKIIGVGALMLLMTPVIAQSNYSGSSILYYSIIGVAAALLIWAIISMASSLIRVESDRLDENAEDGDLNFLPSVSNSFGGGSNASSSTASKITTKKGYNIKLKGVIKDNTIHEKSATRVSISPYEYRGIAPIPKMFVEIGDVVKTGQSLFYDKAQPDVHYVAPVSGEVLEIIRGPKRSIAEVVLLADKVADSRVFDVPNLNNYDQLVKFLGVSGLWVSLTERPFDIVPTLGTKPRDIFITTFDTAPLAPDSEVILAGRTSEFQKGLEILSKLTDGKVYVGLNGNKANSSFKVEANNNVKYNYFAGKHPIGNVGVQIHKIDAIRPKDKVWTIPYQDVIRWGALFLTGKMDSKNVVAVTGYGVKEPKYIRIMRGASIKDVLAGEDIQDNVRIISGDVLSGVKKEIDQYIGLKEDQVTIIKEGNVHEFMGWLLPLKAKPTVSRTFPSYFMKNKRFEANTNTNGEERAFVVTGTMEDVLPMDIYIQYLMKAILTEDFERMEGLGIYELTEEDVALSEFVSVSKAPLQEILREGLDLVYAQG